MNYAVHTHQTTDLGPLSRILAYQMTVENDGTRGLSLMTRTEAQALADSFQGSGITATVLPLEPAFSLC